MKRLPVWRRPYFAKRILDIGPGHNPFHGATHLLEMDLADGRERCGQKLVVPESAALIVGEATALPFKTGSFDYVYASHVFEHVMAPRWACNEVMRVSEAGYIETPSPFREQGLALKDEQSPEHWYHRWFVFSPDKNLLVFEPKTPEEVSRFCSCPAGEFLREFYASLDFREAEHFFRRKAKTTIFYWSGSFQYEVRDRTMDCRKDGCVCRYWGMKQALLANCHDVLRANRIRRLRKRFPECREVFRKYGHHTLLIN